MAFAFVVVRRAMARLSLRREPAGQRRRVAACQHEQHARVKKTCAPNLDSFPLFL